MGNSLGAGEDLAYFFRSSHVQACLVVPVYIGFQAREEGLHPRVLRSARLEECAYARAHIVYTHDTALHSIETTLCRYLAYGVVLEFFEAVFEVFESRLAMYRGLKEILRSIA